jgi:uncharacterized protein (TIGR02001 family)
LQNSFDEEISMMKKLTAAVLLCTAGLSAPVSVLAEEASSPWSLSANAGVYSDYRFRGVSLNTENIAVQGGVDASYAISEGVSFYVGNWNSSLDKDAGFGNMEVDFYGGVTGTADNVTWKLGAVSYLYPDAKNVDYYEIQAEVATTVGPLTAAFGTYIAPKQKNFGDKTGVYLYTNLSAGIPDTGVTVKGGFGYEDNAYFNSKLDWNIGAFYTYKIATIGLSYIDTNRTALYPVNKNGADGTVVGSLVFNF